MIASGRSPKDACREPPELLVDTKTHRRSPVTELDLLTQQQREQRIDRLYEDLAEQVDLSWVQRPWKQSRSH